MGPRGTGRLQCWMGSRPDMTLCYQWLELHLC